MNNVNFDCSSMLNFALAYLGKSVGKIFEKCIKYHDYSCLLIVNKFDDCEKFANAITDEMKDGDCDEFTMHIKRVRVVHPMYSCIEFKNGSVIRVMHYHKPATGSIIWGEKFNCVVDISDAPFDSSVERYLQSVIVPYTYVTDVDCDEQGDSGEANSPALDEFLSGFTIISEEGE